MGNVLNRSKRPDVSERKSSILMHRGDLRLPKQLSERRSESPFHALAGWPRELLLEIASYLDIIAIGRLGRTCRALCIVSNDDMIWKRFVIRGHWAETPDSLGVTCWKEVYRRCRLIWLFNPEQRLVSDDCKSIAVPPTHLQKRTFVRPLLPLSPARPRIEFRCDVLPAAGFVIDIRLRLGTGRVGHTELHCRFTTFIIHGHRIHHMDPLTYGWCRFKTTPVGFVEEDRRIRLKAGDRIGFSINCSRNLAGLSRNGDLVWVQQPNKGVPHLANLDLYPELCLTPGVEMSVMSDYS
eukprot:TRINITY_DN4348_c0_g6_i1.p1 TRINITY_DN4348_c0_g6~~TRINITY_DN4348_c0_g6_i1.p1  ORF type:complete len:295 (+),score=9.14 TRINITY_DN4348_c0_g6_i1:99-983(+)